MIAYHPGYWAVGFSLSLKGSVLPKSLAWALPCGVATYLCHVHFHKSFDHWEPSMLGTNFISSLMFILGFLIVFRVTQAYSRWWEGGSLLLQVRGEWFNAFSSLIALSNPDPERAPDVIKFQHALVRLVSLLYGTAIMQMNTMEAPSIEIIDIDGFDELHMKHLAKCHDKVEIVLQWIQKSVVQADAAQVIKAAPPILTRVYNQLGAGIAILSGARKISEFPIPFPIAQQITLMLQMQCIITPFISAISVQNPYWATALAVASTLCLWSMNYLAVELEMPFGDDLNDLPLQHLQADMNASLLGLMDPKAASPPAFKLCVSDQGDAYLRTQLLAVKSDGETVIMEKDVEDTSEAEVSKCSCLKKAKDRGLSMETLSSALNSAVTGSSGKKVAAVRKRNKFEKHTFHIGDWNVSFEKAKADLSSPSASPQEGAAAHGALGPHRAHEASGETGAPRSSWRQAEDGPSIRSTASEEAQGSLRVDVKQMSRESKSEEELRSPQPNVTGWTQPCPRSLSQEAPEVKLAEHQELLRIAGPPTDRKSQTVRPWGSL